MRQLTRLLAPVAALGLGLVLVAPTAQAAPPAAKKPSTTKSQCLAAHEEAQSLRTQNKLHASREKFVVCASADCPTVIRKECADQLTQVDATAPTVALEARDEDENADVAVKVLLDGNVVTEKLAGAPLDVEPGEHLFRFERADGKSIEQRVLIVAGEKNRKVVADFATLRPKPVADTTPKPPAPEPEHKLSPLVFVAGGLAVLGFAGFTVFAITGKSKEHELAGSCSPYCSDSDVSPVHRDYLVADISLAVGLVATAVAVILALPSGSSSAKASAAAPWIPRVRYVAFGDAP